MYILRKPSISRFKSIMRQNACSANKITRIRSTIKKGKKSMRNRVPKTINTKCSQEIKKRLWSQHLEAKSF